MDVMSDEEIAGLKEAQLWEDAPDTLTAKRCATIVTQAARIAELEAVLNFYADEWEADLVEVPGSIVEVSEPSEELSDDAGHKARAILAKSG